MKGERGTALANGFYKRLNQLVASYLDETGVSDADLLQLFGTCQQDYAFNMLLHRHGAMVWTVCRQMLPRHQDAEDAFQATFLALSQAQAKLKHVRSVSGWLHNAAVKICLKLRRASARQRQREQAAAVPEHYTTSNPDYDWAKLHAAVHEEVQKLSESHRQAFILCDLQGVKPTLAAERLGWKLGTLSGRLTRARQTLLKRLTQRGLAPLVGGGSVVLSQASTQGYIPFKLLHSTLKLSQVPLAAVPVSLKLLALVATKGSIMKAKLLSVVAVMAVGIGLTGHGTWVSNTEAQGPGAGGPSLPPPASVPEIPKVEATAEERQRAFELLEEEQKQILLHTVRLLAEGQRTVDNKPSPFRLEKLPTSDAEMLTLLEQQRKDGYIFRGQINMSEPVGSNSKLVFEKAPTSATAPPPVPTAPVSPTRYVPTANSLPPSVPMVSDAPIFPTKLPSSSVPPPVILPEPSRIPSSTVPNADMLPTPSMPMDAPRSTSPALMPQSAPRNMSIPPVERPKTKKLPYQVIEVNAEELNNLTSNDALGINLATSVQDAVEKMMIGDKERPITISSDFEGTLVVYNATAEDLEVIKEFLKDYIKAAKKQQGIHKKRGDGVSY